MMDFVKLIFDSKSVREVDENGFLHVAISPLTKEQVAPYYGREIPGFKELGLEPGKIYRGYRPASELSKPETVRSTNGIPIQFRHHPDFADKPAKETRIGATGTDGKWEAPYLMNSLHILDKTAQQVIEDGSMRELSLAYRYDPVFKPGKTASGESYDFIMSNINANHVALVEEGRAGADVLVMDSALEEKKTMLEQKEPATATAPVAKAEEAPKAKKPLENGLDAVDAVVNTAQKVGLCPESATGKWKAYIAGLADAEKAVAQIANAEEKAVAPAEKPVAKKPAPAPEPEAQDEDEVEAVAEEVEVEPKPAKAKPAPKAKKAVVEPEAEEEEVEEDDHDPAKKKYEPEDEDEPDEEFFRELNRKHEKPAPEPEDEETVEDEDLELNLEEEDEEPEEKPAKKPAKAKAKKPAVAEDDWDYLGLAKEVVRLFDKYKKPAPAVAEDEGLDEDEPTEGEAEDEELPPCKPGKKVRPAKLAQDSAFDEDFDEPILAADAIEKRISDKYQAIDECEQTLGRVMPSAFDSADEVYQEAYREISGGQTISKPFARVAYLSWIGGMATQDKPAMGMDAKPKASPLDKFFGNVD